MTCGLGGGVLLRLQDLWDNSPFNWWDVFSSSDVCISLCVYSHCESGRSATNAPGRYRTKRRRLDW